MSIRLRFAPSPTGYLHIGGARTALFNWLYAKKNDGVFILRIEDTDLERSKREHEDQICRDLSWLGLDWNEGPTVGGDFGPYRQSDRNETYIAHIEKLINEGKAYRCTATTEELTAMREEQARLGQRQKYDNRNRDLNLGPDCGKHVVRFKMPLTGETVVEDLIKGRTVFQNEELDDFIIQRSDGSPTYNFVVVVDDHKMRVTHVVRGDDHLNNTPKQINLYAALGAATPRFAHLPLILGPDGKQLSKRHGATSVGSYEEMGIIKEGLFNYLTRLGWAHGDLEIFSASEAAELFDLGGINKAGAKWDMDKLLWVNQQWMMKLSTEDLAERSRSFFERLNIKIEEDRYLQVIETMQQRAQTLVELAEKCRFYFVDDADLKFDEETAAKALKPDNSELLANYSSFLNSVKDWTEESLEENSKIFVREETERRKAAGLKKVKMGQLLFPTRIAICGIKGGPGVYETMIALGKVRTVNRLKLAAEKAAAS